MYKVWAPIDIYAPLSSVAETAKRAEALGFDCLTVPDSCHDGLVAAAIAVQATEKIEIANSALVCFPRSPMTTSVAVWDLQAFSGGRYRLGLGPLVAPNILQKYSTPWHPPAPRMREYIQSMKAIFDCWQNDAPLNYRGKYYSFTRQQEFMKPGKIEHPDIPVHIAGIGPNMTALAGELADGIMTHPTNASPFYIKEVLLKNLQKGAARTGRDIKQLEIVVNPLIATGDSDEAVAGQREKHRVMMATLLSTPPYWPSMELFGWRQEGEYLRQLTRENRWDEMPGVLTDEMLDAFVPAARYEELADLFIAQYGDSVSTFSIELPEDPKHDVAIAAMVKKLQGK